MKYDSKVEENVFKILNERKIKFEVKEHAAVYTSDVAAEIAGYEINAGIKSIVMKLKPSDEFVLVCLPGEKRLIIKQCEQ